MAGPRRKYPLPEIGTRYGRLTIAGEAFRRGTKWYVPCLCDCGNQKLASFPSLYAGELISCGCYRREMQRERMAGRRRHPLPEMGQRYGRLVVVGEAASARHDWFVPCVCDCGTEKRVPFKGLVDGSSRSCGCLQRELSRERMIARRLAAQ